MDSKRSNDNDNERPVNTISGTMSCDEILAQLCAHGCKEVTHQLNLSRCSQHPALGGSFGDVFSGFLQNNDPVAIKCLRIMVGVDDIQEGKQLKRAAHEIYVWSKIDHPNVLKLIGVAQYQNRIAMVSPWMENGSLGLFLSRHPEVNRYTMCAQIADGVGHLHSRGVTHGDIKPLNILVSNDHIPKLTDFGTSILTLYTLQFTNGSGSGRNITVRYTAPEILQEETKLTTEGDVYALGMTILEAMTGKAPYSDLFEPVILTKILTGARPVRQVQHFPIDDEQANALWNLLGRCWQSDPSCRPTPIEVGDKLRALSYQLELQNDSTDETTVSDLSSPQTLETPLGETAIEGLETHSTKTEVPFYESYVPSTAQSDESQLIPLTEMGQLIATARRTRFTSRAVGGQFRDIALTNTARNMINEWHKSAWKGLPVGWEFANEGSPHEPSWQATPIIMDEPHPEYRGHGRSHRDAQNDSATKIMNSGFC